MINDQNAFKNKDYCTPAAALFLPTIQYSLYTTNKSFRCRIIHSVHSVWHASNCDWQRIKAKNISINSRHISIQNVWYSCSHKNGLGPIKRPELQYWVLLNNMIQPNEMERTRIKKYMENEPPLWSVMLFFFVLSSYFY